MDTQYSFVVPNTLGSKNNFHLRLSEELSALSVSRIEYLIKQAYDRGREDQRASLAMVVSNILAGKDIGEL